MGWLDGLFGKKKPNAENKLTSLKGIVKLLNYLQQQRARISIQPRVGGDDYDTFIIGVKEGNNSFSIDELSPPPSGRILPKGQRVFILCEHRGITAKFYTQVLDFGEEHGLPFFTLEIPKLVHYTQKRSGYRVTLPNSGAKSAISLLVPDAGLLKGRVLDLSVGGISAALPGNIKELLSKGDKVPCIMNLENKKSLEFDLEIRHVEYQTGHKPQSLIGGSFLNLKGSQERFIERYVVELQRLLRSRNEQNS